MGKERGSEVSYFLLLIRQGNFEMSHTLKERLKHVPIQCKKSLLKLVKHAPWRTENCLSTCNKASMVKAIVCNTFLPSNPIHVFS